MTAPDSLRLSPDELAWHRTLLAQERAVAEAMRLWSAHLAGKYGLTHGDVLEDGTIRTEAGT